MQIEPTDEQAAILDAFADGGPLAISAGAGTGKALRDDQPVLTPEGWAPIGSLRVGDLAVGSDGLPVPVTGVYPQGVRPLFEVTTSDGVTIVADADHRWVTETTVDRQARQKVGGAPRWGVRTTSEIAGTVTVRRGGREKRTNHYLPLLSAPVAGDPYYAPPLDPWLVGVLIGDGGLTGGGVNLSNPDPGVMAAVVETLPAGVVLAPVSTSAPDGCNWTLTSGLCAKGVYCQRDSNPVIRALRELGLMDRYSFEKVVPEPLMRASAKIRYGLLTGLMDTDGSLNGRTSVEYNTSSPGLAAQVVELVGSLGGIAHIRTRHRPRYTYRGEVRTGRPAYRVSVRLPDGVNPFAHSASAKTWRPASKYGLRRQIVSVRPVAPGHATCISVLASDQLYVTAGHVLTHNTSTLRMLARSRPDARGLYVAYNKAIQEEAKRSFPRSVECRTAHSLAWGAFGRAIKDRMDGARMPAWEVAKAIGAHGTPIGEHGLITGPEVARLVLATVERFCHSASPELDPSHFVPPPVPPGTDVGLLAGEVLRLADRVWDDYSSESGKLRVTHDVYLKLWQLSGPELAYDYILLDEAQDADPAIADVVGRQDAQIVAVGDDSQAIFGWRGSTSVLDAFGRGRKLHLSRSFRFGPEIAAEANLWLDLLGADMRLSGSPQRTSVLGTVRSPRAILCRTNAGTIGATIDVQSRGARVALAGGGKEIAALADAATKMQAGRRTSHPDLVAFSDWDEVRSYAEEDPGGSDLAVAVKLIDTYGAERITAAIDATVAEKQAHTVISTAHKAKGREWSSVRVSGDFPGPRIDKNGQPLPIPRPDAMLAYVTVTRAMERLDASALSWVRTPGLRCAVERSPLSAVPAPAGPSEPAEPPTAIAAGATDAAEDEGASLLEIPLDDELRDALATLTMNGATRAAAARRAILVAASRGPIGALADAFVALEARRPGRSR